MTRLSYCIFAILLTASTITTHADARTSNAYTWQPKIAIASKDAIASEDHYANSVSASLNIQLKRYETKYFLLYTNIAPDAALKWEKQLDPIYAQLTELLSLPKNYNIWRGKAAIYLFKNKDQFVHFEKKYYKNDITYEAALCHQHYTGEVRLALYNTKDQLFLHQLFVHEMMHGIIHRYHTSKRIPTWLNEGISEWASHKIVGDAPMFKLKKDLSKKFLHNTGYLPNDFFGDYTFKPEFYGTAYTLTQTLNDISKNKFIQFIKLIKEHHTWQNALKTAYKMTPGELIQTYAKHIGLKKLPLEKSN